MPRFRVRAKLPTGQPVIVKVDADNSFLAAAQAGKMIAEDNTYPLSSMSDLVVRQLGTAKSRVYVGKVPSARAPRKTAATTAAPTVTTAAPAATTAAPTVTTAAPATAARKK